MSRIVKRIPRNVLANAFNDESAVRSIEGVVRFCADAIPEVVQSVTGITAGATVSINAIQAGEFYNVWLILEGATTPITGLTIVFPVGAGINAPLEGQSIEITSRTAFNSVVFNGNGATILTSLTSLAASSTIRFKFYQSNWHKVA